VRRRREARISNRRLTINLEQKRKKKMSNLIKKYPAISQFVLALLIGGGMIAPMVAGVVPSDSMFLIIAAYSASLAGIILTAIVSGKAGLRQMFRRLLFWRAGIGWWAFALIAFALLYLGGLVLAALYSGSTLSVNLAQPLYMFFPLFIMKFFLDSGLGEELGWRGFLLPRLQARYSALVSSIIVGIVWGLWHLPLFMLEGMSPTYEMGQAWFELFRDPDNLIGPYIGFSAILFVTAIVVVLISGAKNLSRKHERIMIKDT
jgi:membrane protease YdiL (CAAX protease family)